MLAEIQEPNAGITPQRSNGVSKVVVKKQDGATRLEDLFQEGCAKLRLPKIYDQNHLEAVMINTAGGMTGGDCIRWCFEAGQDSRLTATSQACERIYQSSGGTADIKVSLQAKKGSTLNWLPQETILYDQASARRKIQVDLEADARVLMVESLVFGRAAMGEVINNCRFTDDWRVSHNGRLVHVEANHFQGEMEPLLSDKAIMDGGIATATVLLLAPTSTACIEEKLRKAQMIVGSVGDERGGVSLWEIGSTGKLLARLIAKDGYELRKRLIPLISLLNDEAALPKSWAI